MKKCISCHQEKIDEDFEISSTTITKIHRKKVCKVCRKSIRKFEKQLQKIYGKTKPLGTPCDCCGRTDIQLSLDHCHTLGTFRGWLCQQCNVSIGGLGDNIEGLEKAFLYLKKAYHNSIVIE